MKILNMMIYVLFWIFCSVYSEKCYNKSSDGSTETWFCCNNHEDRNGICTECEIGYVSKDGLPCKPCSLGRWGKKCVNTCSCQHNERCDFVYGCIEGTTVIPGTDQIGKCYDKSSNTKYKSWFCCNNYEQKNGKCTECESGYISKDGFPCQPCSPGQWGTKCIHTCSCQHDERCDVVYGCVKESSMKSEGLEKTTPRDTNQNTSQANRNSAIDTKDGLRLIIYSMGAGSIAVILALAACCLKYKRKAEYFLNTRSTRTHHNKETAKRSSISRNKASANDLIGENTGIDNNVNQAGIRYSATDDQDWLSGSFSFSDEEISEHANEGFLNSYLSMTEVDKHPTLLNATTQNKLSSVNSVSITDYPVQIYGNIHPYEQIVPFDGVHTDNPLDKVVSKHRYMEQSLSDFKIGNDISKI